MATQYKSRNDRELMQLLVHYERAVRAFDSSKFIHRQRPLKVDANLRAEYLRACDLLLKHIEDKVNTALEPVR